MRKSLNIGDRFEGVLLETITGKGSTRPRVRPLEYFDNEIRVEFPRGLREDNPIGSRFRADIKVSQKTKNNKPWGRPYLVATNSSIVKLDNFKPSRLFKAINLNTASGRSYMYLEKEFETNSNLIKFEEFRKKAYEKAVGQPEIMLKANSSIAKRSDLIKIYALSRARGNCEGCLNEAPFLKRNGQPYLEVHHIKELSKGGSDSPINVIALCPNCHTRVTRGIDGLDFNFELKKRIALLEEQLSE